MLTFKSKFEKILCKFKYLQGYLGRQPSDLGQRFDTAVFTYFVAPAQLDACIRLSKRSS